MLKLSDVNPQRDMEKDEYRRRLREAQLRLGELVWEVYHQNRFVIFVYEGWDAAGKGGNIRRLVQGMDPRGFKVHPIAAPKGDEKEYHYLWRFWKRLPPKSEIAIFDRSWYGRVLVERVEGFATAAEWQRAYEEINHFERQLIHAGGILLKFWIHISPEEQLRRFKERQNTDYKAWKLTPDDWRNREKWRHYEEAVDEMLLKTNLETAPWTVVAGNSKRFARVLTCETTIATLERQLL